MIDLKLTEIFSILGVGIFVVITIVYFFFLVQRLFNIRRHNKNPFFLWLQDVLKNNYKDSGYALVTGILVYSAGLLIQDITDHMTDSERNFNPLISFVKNVNLIDNEGEMRRASLIENDVKLTGLGREVFKNARDILHVDSAERLELFNDKTEAGDYWKMHGKTIMKDEEQTKSLMTLVSRIYYTSKNWCYLKSDPVRKELESIQERIDFSRSICIISFLGICGILLLYTGYHIRELFKKKSSRYKIVTCYPVTKEVNKRMIQRKVFFPFRSVFILVLIMWVAQVCYVAAEKNFNERAMGYYVSQLKLEKVKQSASSAKVP